MTQHRTNFGLAKSLTGHSLRASPPIWASKASRAGTRERAAKPRGAGDSLARSREARFACPNTRACSQARPDNSFTRDRSIFSHYSHGTLNG